MKIKLLLFYISIIIFSCNNVDHYDSIKGSWYNLNKKEKTYEEIHIDDSLFIFCYDNCDMLLTFNYSIKDDSIYLFFDKENVKYKYQILFNKLSKKEMTLINKKERLIFKKMDESYENLNDFLVDYDSLDSLSLDYHQRKKDIMDSLKNP